MAMVIADDPEKSALEALPSVSRPYPLPELPPDRVFVEGLDTSVPPRSGSGFASLSPAGIAAGPCLRGRAGYERAAEERQRLRS